MIQLSIELGAALCHRLHNIASMPPRAAIANKVDLDYNTQIIFARNVLKAILPQLPREACSKINRADPRWSGK